MPVSEGGKSGASELLYAGVELGGTKCICTLANGPDTIVEQQTIATTVPWETLPAILATLQNWRAAYGFAALGVASFGPLELNPDASAYGRILATNKPHWADTDVLGELRSAFALPIGFDTDVNGAALAELRWGAGQGLDDFAYVTVGTGIGVGLIVHGRPTRGIGHSEIGHIRVPRFPGDTLPSACRYHDDCVEGLASGQALAARLNGRPPSVATPDDPVWEPIVHYLAVLAHMLACATGPLRVVMGGGVISGQPHLLDRINQRLSESLAGYMEIPDPANYVAAPALGTLAGPLGSIALAKEAHRRHAPGTRSPSD